MKFSDHWDRSSREETKVTYTEKKEPAGLWTLLKFHPICARAFLKKDFKNTSLIE